MRGDPAIPVAESSQSERRPTFPAAGEFAFSFPVSALPHVRQDDVFWSAE
jgi:hypothetical protein